MELLQSIDRDLFLFLNGLHTDFLDPLMLFSSGKLTWIPFYLFLLYIVYRRQRWQGLLWYILAIGLVVLLADRLSVVCFKDVFERLRPCHNPSIASLVYLPSGRCGGLYGFVSSHAANVFGITLLSILFVRQRWFTFLLLCWALLVCYSRIYLGVHYPGDILCGAILGAGCGALVVLLIRFTHRFVPIHWQLKYIR
ncbi:MAG: phosphatase PAP2 family protein [Bacteroides sp.]